MCSSSTQHAEASALAGPPQQPLGYSVDGFRRLRRHAARRGAAGARLLVPSVVAFARALGRSAARTAIGPFQGLSPTPHTPVSGRLSSTRFGGFEIACDGGHHRASLLEPGGHQERGRTTVALDPHGVQAGLRMRELAVPMRAHGATAVLVGIDQRTQRFVRLQPRVELDAQLAGQRQVRPLTGGANDLVDAVDAKGFAVAIDARDEHLAALLDDLGDAQPRVEFERAGVAQAAQRRAERSTCRQGIGIATAEDASQDRRAHAPHQSRAWDLLGQFGQCEQGIRSAVPGPDDQRLLACIARAMNAQHIRNTVEDARRRFALTDCGQAAGAHRIRRVPGAGAVDDRACAQLDRPAVTHRTDDERRALATFALHLVVALARHRDDPRAQM